MRAIGSAPLRKKAVIIAPVDPTRTIAAPIITVFHMELVVSDVGDPIPARWTMSFLCL